MKTVLPLIAVALLAGTPLAADPFASAPGGDWGGFHAGLHYGPGEVDARGPAGGAESDLNAWRPWRLSA